jgi:uncharacterized protein YndB with AHSA1/START domain
MIASRAASTRRAETRSISIEAPVTEVFDFVADPRNLPRWAPGFARSVRPAGDDWLVDSGEGDGETRVTVPVSREQGTVDFVLTDDPQRASYSRVVPNQLGSEYIFTLFFPDGTDEEAVAQRMAVIEEELAAVRALCEG